MARPCRFVGYIFRCLVCYVIYLTTFINCEKVILLDSTQHSRLGWTTHRKDTSDIQNQGWREGSYTKNGSPVRVYASCSVSSVGVDNWLRTPFIDRGKANSITVEIEFSMRKCVRHSDPSSLQQCKETFHLYYYEADSDFANEGMPSWDDTTYTKVDVIAANYLYEGTKGEEIKLNFEKQEIALNKGLRGVYLAFQDTGACVSLISVKVYYIKCPNVTMNYAFFLETPTGSSPQALEEREGVCVANSQMETTKATLLCRSTGTWYYNSGNCQCIAGYEGNNGTECVACKTGYYKMTAGNQKCYSCPEHSYTNVPQSVECTCDTGYYRGPDDPKDMKCTQPPSAPINLHVTSKTNNKLALGWMAPAYNGGRQDIYYRVRCFNCDANVLPGRDIETKNTSLTLVGLLSSTEYNITVYCMNGVSVISNQQPQSDSIRVRTEFSLAVIDNLHIVTKHPSGTVVIAWDLAQHVKEEVDMYQVKWYPSGYPNQVLQNETTFQNYTFHNLDLSMVYLVQIRGRTTTKGWGDYSDPLQIKEGDNQLEKVEMEQPTPSVGIIVGSIIAVFLCMSIAAIMIIILLKRNRPQCSETKGGDCDTLHYGHVHCPPLDPHMNGGLTMPLFTPQGSIKTYVDPHTYEDPNQAVREFTKEIDSSNIVIESVIGGGEFGDVCKGKLRVPRRIDLTGGQKDMNVAIKTLKQGATDKNRLEFLTEASIMGQFDDPNVIYLEGVVTKNHPIMIVTEFMANGSLDTFLRTNDGKFTVIQLVGMMRGIASGMSYLAEMGYVHRDLAARNILVGENLMCKVADFGLSREIDLDTTEGAYTTKGGKIPVRWTAPEAIAFRKFTSASDVWSYGVVMWEIISYGERPYWNWSNQYVIQAVERGFRLPPPMDCPEAIHQLMLDCWQKERGNRPKFQQVVRSHDKFIRAPELLKKIAKPRADLLMDLNPINEVSRFSNVEGWLISIKMDRYIQNFLNAGYRTMEQVSTITSRDLETLGVTLIGHQKKIMNSIQTLRTQLYGPHIQNMSEGFLV